MKKFIGRKDELQILTQLYESANSKLMVIYGRRRVGKTTLIEEFMSGKKEGEMLGCGAG